VPGSWLELPPDGHTLLMIISTHTVLPSVQPKLPYDLVRDFAAVIHVANLSNFVVARNALPHSAIAEILKTLALKSLIDSQGEQIAAHAPAKFGAYIRTELKRWSEILADTNIKQE
jgi:tripartite-type tricarboxylate transporter receptor subunit TctC